MNESLYFYASAAVLWKSRLRDIAHARAVDLFGWFVTPRQATRIHTHCNDSCTLYHCTYPCSSFCCFRVLLLFCSVPLSYLASHLAPVAYTLATDDRPLTSIVNIVGNDYPPPSQPSQQQHRPQHPSSTADLSSPTNARYAQQFYPAYAQQSATAGASMPPSVPDAMDSMPPHASALANPITASVKKNDEDEQTRRNLFGDVPESKRRKFILVDDSQRGTRVRVRVMLDQVNMDEMPDAHLRTNAVYPRSYYPRQMRSPPGSPRARGQWDDEDDTQEGGSPTRGKTFVPVQMADGTDSKLPVPRMTKSRRDKEMALNELGYRMAWGQARTFNGRTLFLQRSCKLVPQPPIERISTNDGTVDAYRNKMRSTMIAGGQDAASIAPHFETRPGKRRWNDRNKRARRAPDSP